MNQEPGRLVQSRNDKYPNMQNRVRSQPDGVQISYDLPVRCSDASVYPVPASDGASVVVVGHSKGLSVFKAYGNTQYGQNRGDGIREIEDDSNHHSPEISTWLEIPLESPVQHVAFPPVSPAILSSQSSAAPEYLRANIIVAVACADSSIHLISFGIDSSLEQTNGGRDGSGFKTTKLDSSASHHQDMISALAVTWTMNDEPTDQHKSRSRSRGRTGATDETQSQYSFLIASSSTTGSGLLVVHRLPFLRHVGVQGHSPVIVARQFMRMPLLRSTVCFNPASYPSTKHSTLLITSPAHGVVKVLDISQSGLASKRRRGSEMDADNEEPSALPSASTCLTLHAGYSYTSTPPSRKQILDARWAANGKVIVALLEDGNWGSWNIEAAGAAGNNDALPVRAGRGNVAQNGFAVHGNVSAALQKTKISKTKPSGSLAPMTPHTRKARSADLFGSNEPRALAKPATKSPTRITICPAQAAVAGTDDTLIISFDGDNNFIPSLQSLQRSDGRNNAANAAYSTGRVQALPTIRLGGEVQITISLLNAPHRKSNAFSGILSTEQVLIVLTNSRLILHKKLESKPAFKSTTLNLPLRSANGNDTTFMSRITNNSTLDLDAMDKLLQSMDNTEDQQNPAIEAPSNLPFQQTSRARTVDPDMASPTIPKSIKSKLIIQPEAANGRHNLFK